MPVEVELKFLADTEAPLDALAAAERLGTADLGPAETFDEVDRYVDTPDGRLAERLWACRLRSRHGALLASLKGPPEAVHGDGPLHRRPEVEGPAGYGLQAGAWPASEARTLLLEFTGGAPLEERLLLRQRRTEREVLVGGELVGTLSLDRVEVGHRGRTAGLLRIVELELTDERFIDPLRAALAELPGLRPDPQTKLERALRLIGEAV